MRADLEYLQSEARSARHALCNNVRGSGRACLRAVNPIAVWKERPLLATSVAAGVMAIVGLAIARAVRNTRGESCGKEDRGGPARLSRLTLLPWYGLRKGIKAIAGAVVGRVLFSAWQFPVVGDPEQSPSGRPDQ